MFTADTIKFGVEIETVIPRGLCRVGGYHAGAPVPFLPDRWTVSHDASINVPDGFVAGEFVSPILTGADGLNQIKTVCETLKARGAKVNPSCGVHISVDWGRQTPSEKMAKLLNLVSYVEPALYAISGTHKRENGGWCRSVQQYGNQANARAHAEANRYHLLNLVNLTRGQDRVEFRAFSGSLSALKICGWAQVCVGLVEKAKAVWYRAPWERKKNAGLTERAFQGQEATYDLFVLRRQLGWYPFQIKKGKACGLMTNAPFSREEIIHEFTRLVNKYEAENRR